MEYSLKIFVKTRDNAKINKIADVIFWLFIVSWVLALILMKYNMVGKYPILVLSGVSIMIIIMSFVFTIYSHFSYEELLGYFGGKILFKENMIKIKDKEISIEDIKKIEFSDWDYLGRRSVAHEYGRGSNVDIDGVLSQGVKNELLLIKNNGEKIEVNFLQTKENQLREMEPLLIHYCQKGIIHRLHFMDILELGYDEIQEYKQKYGI